MDEVCDANRKNSLVQILVITCMTMQTQVFVSSRNAPPAQMIDFKKLNYIRTAKTQKDLGQSLLL